VKLGGVAHAKVEGVLVTDGLGEFGEFLIRNEFDGSVELSFWDSAEVMFEHAASGLSSDFGKESIGGEFEE